MAKTFLLGVGCQKGGTSWLHDYLRGHPQTDMGFTKEYHVFDGLFVPECRGARDEVVAAAQKLLAQPLSRQLPNALKLLDFYRDPANYFDYFQYLALRSDAVRLTGDITPSYAALPPEAFGLIRSNVEGRGLAIRVVFLMRDPVERIISAVRMLRRHERYYDPNVVHHESEAEHVRRMYADPGVAIRTRYEVTLARLEQAFAPETVFHDFYESLFERERIRELDAFLGIDFVEPDFGKQVNVSRTEAEIGDDLRREVFDHYRPTYDAVAARFGRERLRTLWPSYAQFG